MRTSYEVRSASRRVSLQKANTAQEAVIEYLRSIGCHNDEIVRVAVDAVAWRVRSIEQFRLPATDSLADTTLK